MIKAKHRRVNDYDPFTHHDIELIKSIFEDEREGVDYYTMEELMNLLEIIDTNFGFRVEMTHNSWQFEHKYKKFGETFMWYDDTTRKRALAKVIVRVLRWWNKPDRHIIEEYLKEQEEKTN